MSDQSDNQAGSSGAEQNTPTSNPAPAPEPSYTPPTPDPALWQWVEKRQGPPGENKAG